MLYYYLLFFEKIFKNFKKTIDILRTNVYNIFILNEIMFVGGIVMKIVNFKKFIRSICLILLVIFILSLICAKGTLSHKEVEYTTIYVENRSGIKNSYSVGYCNKEAYYLI